jgi:small subunit ribosomal protein S21
LNKCQKNQIMLIIKIDNKTPIEKALKLFKSKVIKTKLMTELKQRKEYTKKSIKRRDEVKKAVFSQKIKRED